MVAMSPAILKIAEIGVARQVDIALLWTPDGHDIVFAEMFALMDKFHETVPLLR